MEYTFDPRELYGAFKVDAEEQLDAFRARLSRVRSGVPTEDDWDDLYRAIHTVKGGGAILGLRLVTELAEAMCQALRRERARPTASDGFWETVSEAASALEQLITASLSGGETRLENVERHMEQLATVA